MRKTLQRTMWIAASLALAACAAGSGDVAVSAPGSARQAPPVETVISTAPTAGRSCPADQFETLIGQPEAAARAALAPIPTPVRFVCWNCQVTMDFLATRLNVMLDQKGVVDALTCG